MCDWFAMASRFLTRNHPPEWLNPSIPRWITPIKKYQTLWAVRCPSGAMEFFLTPTPCFGASYIYCRSLVEGQTLGIRVNEFEPHPCMCKKINDQYVYMIYLSIHPSIHRSIYLSLFIYLSVCPSVRWSIHLSNLSNLSLPNLSNLSNISTLSIPSHSKHLSKSSQAATSLSTPLASAPGSPWPGDGDGMGYVPGYGIVIPNMVVGKTQHTLGKILGKTEFLSNYNPKEVSFWFLMVGSLLFGAYQIPVTYELGQFWTWSKLRMCVCARNR